MSREVDYDEGSRHWHLDKRLNLGHLLTTIVLAISLFGWANAMDRRVSVLEAQLVAASAASGKVEQSAKETATLLREDIRALREEMREVSRKLDDPRKPR